MRPIDIHATIGLVCNSTDAHIGEIYLTPSYNSG
jgi:hypothetical protein